jgi:hypothetical protein
VFAVAESVRPRGRNRQATWTRRSQSHTPAVSGVAAPSAARVRRPCDPGTSDTSGALRAAASRTCCDGTSAALIGWPPQVRRSSDMQLTGHTWAPRVLTRPSGHACFRPSDRLDAVPSRRASATGRQPDGGRNGGQPARANTEEAARVPPERPLTCDFTADRIRTCDSLTPSHEQPSVDVRRHAISARHKGAASVLVRPDWWSCAPRCCTGCCTGLAVSSGNRLLGRPLRAHEGTDDAATRA